MMEGQGIEGDRNRYLIEVVGLEKVYRSRAGDVHALSQVTFSVKEGEFLAIVGPSGCGKSTLLNIIAGLVPKTDGSVTIEKKEVKRPQTNLGIVFQDAVLLEWRNVLQNIMLQIEIRRLPKERYLARAMELLKQVNLKGFENHHPYGLSGGMKQRVSICRALIHDPPLLLMDEPFGALDTLTREQMNLDLQKLWVGSKKTVIFVTHSIQEAVFLSDRVIGMTARPGKVALVEEIELPRPRHIDMIETTEFAKHTRVLRNMFRSHGVISD